MRHLRSDYDAIQPWPVKRPHIFKDNNRNVFGIGDPILQIDSENPNIPVGNDVHPIIPDDEPVFIIRAMDAVGPATIRNWADRATAAGADADMCLRVWQWADEMDRYAKTHGGAKIPDTPRELLR